MQERALSYRSFRRDIESYINPFTAPDPGMQAVAGKIAEGFNLDGNAKTGGFTSPSGEKGIDNAFYRALGCIGSYRGMPYSAAMSVRSNDKMLEGMYTMVIRLSGNKSPMNDDAATLEIGYSPDHVNKQTDGRASTSYSFRIVKDGQYSKLKAVIKDGVLETEPGGGTAYSKVRLVSQSDGRCRFPSGAHSSGDRAGRFCFGADRRLPGLA